MSNNNKEDEKKEQIQTQPDISKSEEIAPEQTKEEEPIIEQTPKEEEPIIEQTPKEQEPTIEEEEQRGEEISQEPQEGVDGEHRGHKCRGLLCKIVKKAIKTGKEIAHDIREHRKERREKRKSNFSKD